MKDKNNTLEYKKLTEKPILLYHANLNISENILKRKAQFKTTTCR